VTDTVIVRFEGDGAYAVALSPPTSSQSVAVQLVVNNRFRLTDKVFLCINDTPDALYYEFQADTAEGGTRAVPSMGAVR
jgi:hypothetical protein